MRMAVAGASEFAVRPLLPSDASLIRRAFFELSVESRYLRYGLPISDPARVLGWVDGLDGTQNAAVGALNLRTGALLGGARYATVEEGSYAEIAGFVIDAWQGRGIGSRLLAELLRHAGNVGIAELRARVLPGNRRARRLLASTGAWRVRGFRDGFIDYGFSRAEEPRLSHDHRGRDARVRGVELRSQPSHGTPVERSSPQLYTQPAR
jgi:RimJ/RimL family protein N-acetyltransferase